MTIRAQQCHSSTAAGFGNSKETLIGRWPAHSYELSDLLILAINQAASFLMFFCAGVACRIFGHRWPDRPWNSSLPACAPARSSSATTMLEWYDYLQLVTL